MRGLQTRTRILDETRKSLKFRILQPKTGAQT
jgi:hypothetical protein